VARKRALEYDCAPNCNCVAVAQMLAGQLCDSSGAHRPASSFAHASGISASATAITTARDRTKPQPSPPDGAGSAERHEAW
jgi:hypothetical protein